AIFALFMLPASVLAQADATVALPEVNVIAPSPLGGYVDRDKVPGTVQTLTAPDFTRTESPNVTETLFQRIPGVSISDPNGTGAAQTGFQLGDDAVYLAAQGSHQGGWRFQSSADYARMFADIGRRTDRGEFHLIAAGATSSLGVAAATPIQLLDLNDRAVFTT